MQELANAASSIKGLLDTLATTFMSQTNGHPRNSSISELRAAQGGVFVGEARNFVSDDGIREDFQGGQGGQIRHFVGGLIAASVPGGTTAMILREGLQTDRDSNADRRLNTLAGSIYQTAFTRPFRSLTGGRRPASLEQVKESLADEIRRGLCGP